MRPVPITMVGASLLCTGLGSIGCGDNAAGDGLCSDDPCTGAGCAPVLLYGSEPDRAGPIGADSGEVCLSFDAPPEAPRAQWTCVHRCSGNRIGSGEFAPLSLVANMLVDQGEVTMGLITYPHGPSELWRLPTHAAADATLLTSTVGDGGFSSLARRGDALYYYSRDFENRGIFTLPYLGGQSTQISDWGLASLGQGMSLVDDAVYVISDDPAHAGLYSLSVTGGVPRQLRVPLFEMTGVAASRDHVVWIELGPGGVGASVAALTLGAEDVIPLLSTAAPAFEFVVDDARAYVVVGDPGDQSIVSIALSSGDAQTMLAGQQRLAGLTQDADYLYFVGDHGVYRLRKPK